MAKLVDYIIYRISAYKTKFNVQQMVKMCFFNRGNGVFARQMYLDPLKGSKGEI